MKSRRRRVSNTYPKKRKGNKCKCNSEKNTSTKSKSKETRNRKPNKQTEPEVVIIKLPDLEILEKGINETVIGQEKVVKSVCTKVYQGICFPQLKTNILLVGKSGTGKTEIIRQLAEHLDLPCVIEDSTRYTEEGYVGADVTDMLKNLIKAADGDRFLASRGIIFVDEIDKKSSRGEYQRNNDVNKKGVLNGLLKIIEGTIVEIPNPNYSFEMPVSQAKIKFNTSNIIFIFGGAFEGLEEIKEARLKKNKKIGFTSPEANHIVINNYMNTSFIKEDLIEYGMPAEFVGRISSIYETRELQVEDLQKILANSKKSEFRKYENIFNLYGIKLVYSDRLFELIARNARKSSTGARELNSFVAHIFEKIMYDALSCAGIDKYTECILDDEIVSDNTRYRWK